MLFMNASRALASRTRPVDERANTPRSSGSEDDGSGVFELICDALLGLWGGPASAAPRLKIKIFDIRAGRRYPTPRTLSTLHARPAFRPNEVTMSAATDPVARVAGAAGATCG